MSGTAYLDGYSIGKIHADSAYDIDPRWLMAEHAKKGTLDEFMRGFDDGYEGKAKDVLGHPFHHNPDIDSQSPRGPKCICGFRPEDHLS